MNSLNFLYLTKIKTYYDDPPAVPPTVPPVPPPPPTPPATFTQEQVNKMMADHKRSLQKEREDLVKQLEQHRDTANLTAQEKQALEERIANLSQQHLTEAQKLQAELETTKKKLKTETESLVEDSRKWKESYEKLLVTNSILTGAATHQAANKSQLEAMLLPKAKVVEVVGEDGKPTGNFAVKLPMTVIDAKTKQPVTLDVDMIEAIGKMREDKENANLFLFDGKVGLGGNNDSINSGGKGPDWSNMTPAEHRKARKQSLK